MLVYKPGKYASAAVCGECGGNQKTLDLCLADVIAGREDDYPTLSRSLADAVPAHNPVIEWTHGGYVGKNYVQIFRTPFSVRGMSEEEALAQHLLAIEQTLLFGSPRQWVEREHKFATCGGVYHFLGRAPRDGDTIRLRPLRELAFYANRGRPDEDDVIHEWLSELSLQVSPA